MKENKNYLDENKVWHVYPKENHIGQVIFYIDCPLCGRMHSFSTNILHANYDGRREFKCYNYHKNKNNYIVEPIYFEENEEIEEQKA